MLTRGAKKYWVLVPSLSIKSKIFCFSSSKMTLKVERISLLLTLIIIFYGDGCTQTTKQLICLFRHIVCGTAIDVVVSPAL